MDVKAFGKNIEHLKCPVCKKVMRIPKRLPCKHTVCQGCLTDHIVRTVPMSGYDIFEYLGKTFPDIKPVKDDLVCPVPECNTTMSPRNPLKPTYEWAVQAENNVQLLSVLKLCTGELPGASQSCDKCFNLSWKSQIKSVCFTCFQKMCLKCEYIHKQLYSDHVVCDVPNSNKAEFMRVLHETKSPDALPYYFPAQNGSPNICKVHSPHGITMFCMSCTEKCCEKCFENRHSQCQGKTKLTELSKVVNAKEILEKTKSKLETCRERCLSTSAEFVVMLQEIYQKQMALKNKVEGAESGNEAQAEADQEGPMHTLSCYVSRFEYMRDNIQNCLSKLSMAEGMELLDSYGACYILQCQKMCKEIESQLIENGRKAAELKHTVEAYIKTVVENLEKAEHKSKGKDHTRSYFEALVLGKEFTKISDESEKVKMLTKLKVTTESDTKECWLTDCQFLDENCIVVADNENKKVKLVSLNDRIQDVQLESGPWGIATEKGHLIGVTLPDLCTLQVYEAKSSDRGYTINEIRKQIFKSKCYGVTFLEQLIAVTQQDGSMEKIILLNENGEVLREIPLHGVKTKYIRSIASNDMVRIILSNFTCQKIVMLDLGNCDSESEEPVDLQCEIHVGYAAGLDTGDDGQVLYCNNSSGNICRVRTDSGEREITVPLDAKQRGATTIVHGEEQEVILVKALGMPRSLSYHRHTRRLVVTVDSGPQKNYVCMYEINP